MANYYDQVRELKKTLVNELIEKHEESANRLRQQKLKSAWELRPFIEHHEKLIELLDTHFSART